MHVLDRQTICQGSRIAADNRYELSTAFPSGDAFIVYPGPDGKPLASLRLMVAEEAFNDLRALKLLEGLSSRDAVLEMIDKDLKKPISFAVFPRNDSYLLDLRQRINTAIKSLL